MEFMVISQNEVAAMLALEKTAISGGTLVIGLLVGVDTIDQNFTLAEAEAAEPAGDWYARIAGTIGDAYLDAGGNLCLTFTSVQFNYSGSDPGEVISGYFVATNATLRLVGARLLNTPVLMDTTLSACIVEPGILIPPLLGA